MAAPVKEVRGCEMVPQESKTELATHKDTDALKLSKGEGSAIAGEALNHPSPHSLLHVVSKECQVLVNSSAGLSIGGAQGKHKELAVGHMDEKMEETCVDSVAQPKVKLFKL